MHPEMIETHVYIDEEKDVAKGGLCVCEEEKCMRVYTNVAFPED